MVSPGDRRRSLKRAAPARGVLIPAPSVKDTEPSISRPPVDSSSADQGISPGPVGGTADFLLNLAKGRGLTLNRPIEFTDYPVDGLNGIARAGNRIIKLFNLSVDGFDAGGYFDR